MGASVVGVAVGVDVIAGSVGIDGGTAYSSWRNGGASSRGIVPLRHLRHCRVAGMAKMAIRATRSQADSSRFRGGRVRGGPKP